MSKYRNKNISIFRKLRLVYVSKYRNKFLYLETYGML
jgi:hypothetical protein